MRELLDPRFRLAQGGLFNKAATRILTAIENTYGAVTEGRLVDAVVRALYMNRENERRTFNTVFAVKYVKMLKTADKGMTWHEDTWLETASLTRDKLVHMILDRSKHPLAQYISMPSEEDTKQRMLNMDTGYALCQISTLGWSPTSYACRQCCFLDKCKANTALKYPELYRIRVDYDKANTDN